jgi:hypothetical protein
MSLASATSPLLNVVGTSPNAEGAANTDINKVVAIKPLAKIYSPIYELIKPLVPSCVALPQSALPQRFLNSNLQFHK